jgi:hypothetical protein
MLRDIQHKTRPRDGFAAPAYDQVVAAVVPPFAVSTTAGGVQGAEGFRRLGTRRVGEVGGVTADSRRRAGSLCRRRQVEEEAARFAFGCGLELEGWGVHAPDVVDYGNGAGVEGHACPGDRLERADIDGDFEVLVPFGCACCRGRHGCAPHKEVADGTCGAPHGVLAVVSMPRRETEAFTVVAHVGFRTFEWLSSARCARWAGTQIVEAAGEGCEVACSTL